MDRAGPDEGHDVTHCSNNRICLQNYMDVGHAQQPCYEF